jgi:saccharopine dehydrogenase-like NADP-dependent oxidoreductase
MKHILVLGAGLVARPLVQYLLSIPELRLTAADIEAAKAARVIGGRDCGTAVALDVDDADALAGAVRGADLVVSLLPWTRHLTVAKACLAAGRPLVTTSYVKPEMQALDAEVRAKGLIFLNEMGVDPGVDHMAAMRVIDGVHAAGGAVTGFWSYCGGLPAPKSNTNPFGYKFSWSPAGVMLAAKNDGRYLRDGDIVEVPSGELFSHYWLLDVPGAGTFEAYVNRDALPYRELYGIPEARSMYRGTLRMPGHCDSWQAFKRLGLLDQERRFDFNTITAGRAVAELAGEPEADPRAAAARCMEVPAESITVKKLEWLGLFDAAQQPIGVGTAFDLFASLLERRLAYGPGETDMLIQHHAFEATWPDGRRERITSTLVDEGIPGGDSSMSRTVSLPAAIAVKRILSGDITRTGVQIPVVADIYAPVLDELAGLGIAFVERRERK